jgi:hypothetical protein
MEASAAHRRVGVLLSHVGTRDTSTPSVHGSPQLEDVGAAAAEYAATTVIRRLPTAGLAHTTPVAGNAPVRSAAGGVDVTALTRLLDHDNHEMRDAMKAFMHSDLFKPVRSE